MVAITKELADRKKKNWDVTADIYDQTCKEIGYSNQDIHDQFADDLIDYKGWYDLKRKLDDLYCHNIRNLSTEDLQETLDLSDLGIITRLQKTIEIIKDELANRAILNT
jgi:hypothetical protein